MHAQVMIYLVYPRYFCLILLQRKDSRFLTEMADSVTETGNI